MVLLLPYYPLNIKNIKIKLASDYYLYLAEDFYSLLFIKVLAALVELLSIDLCE